MIITQTGKTCQIKVGNCFLVGVLDSPFGMKNNRADGPLGASLADF
jgi:hypothetical protein